MCQAPLVIATEASQGVASNLSYQERPEAGIHKLVIKDAAHLFEDKFLHLPHILENLLSSFALANLTFDFDFFQKRSQFA